MFRSKALWWTLLIVWISGSTYWHVCKIKNLCDAPLPTGMLTTDSLSTRTGLRVTDGNKQIIESRRNVTFTVSNENVIIYGVTPEIDSLAGYLNAYPNKMLMITGAYGTGEKNRTSYRDLGLARAASLKNYLVSKGVSDSAFVLRSRMDADINTSLKKLTNALDLSIFTRRTSPAVQ